VGKHCNNSRYFKENNYKVKFSISSILKKIKKDNFRKKKTQKNKGKKPS
jgi:Txe/YoeB family toxin of Txe-Axe toxin-antitoxin module